MVRVSPCPPVPFQPIPRGFGRKLKENYTEQKITGLGEASPISNHTSINDPAPPSLSMQSPSTLHWVLLTFDAQGLARFITVLFNIVLNKRALAP